MDYASDQGRLDRIRELTGRNIQTPPPVSEVTTNYLAITGGMVLRLDGRDYYVISDATEGRFGIDDQPKFWVKYAWELATGRRKIIKLVFHEEFSSRIGPFLIRARRSPDKEARILAAVAGQPHFMQGRAVRDRAGNLVRIIDHVPGLSLYRYILDLRLDHRTYFRQVLPGLLAKLIPAYEAMAGLIEAGHQHGDIRTDHLLLEAGSGRLVWIDFDYSVSHADYDLWSLGNVVCFVLGKGIHHAHELASQPRDYPGLATGEEIGPDDLMVFGQNRVANLAKLYPYLPARLNRVVLNFSAGSDSFYDSPRVLIADLAAAAAELETAGGL
jgi:hypothetical protein